MWCCSDSRWCGTQDEHILARKYADRWMARALGVGLFKRRLYRKEVEDTRQVLFSTLNPLAKVSHCSVMMGNWRCSIAMPCKSGRRLQPAHTVTHKALHCCGVLCVLAMHTCCFGHDMCSCCQKVVIGCVLSLCLQLKLLAVAKTRWRGSWLVLLVALLLLLLQLLNLRV